MKRLITASVITLLIVGLTLPVLARGRQGHHGPGVPSPLLNGPLDRIDEIADEIGLTESQYEQIMTLRKSHRHSTETLHSQLRILRDDLRDQMQMNDISKSDVMASIDEISKLENQLMKKDVEAMIQLKSILTEEQQNQLRTMRKEHREQRKMRPQRNGRNGYRNQNQPERFDRGDFDRGGLEGDVE